MCSLNFLQMLKRHQTETYLIHWERVCKDLILLLMTVQKNLIKLSHKVLHCPFINDFYKQYSLWIEKVLLIWLFVKMTVRAMKYLTVENVKLNNTLHKIRLEELSKLSIEHYQLLHFLTALMPMIIIWVK